MLQYSRIILVGSEGIEPPTFRSTTALTPDILFMNIHNYHSHSNNPYSTSDNNCTKSFDHHTSDIHSLKVCHTENICSDVPTYAFPCVNLPFLISRLGILQFFWTLLYGFMIIRNRNEIVTKSKGKFSPTSYRCRQMNSSHRLSISSGQAKQCQAVHKPL